jgi:hypothetical protein
MVVDPESVTPKLRLDALHLTQVPVNQADPDADTPKLKVVAEQSMKYPPIIIPPESTYPKLAYPPVHSIKVPFAVPKVNPKGKLGEIVPNE